MNWMFVVIAVVMLQLFSNQLYITHVLPVSFNTIKGILIDIFNQPSML